METPSFGQRVKQTTMKIIKRTLIFALVLGIGFFAFMYWSVYERGVWAGKVFSVSEKGILFKTHEGKISMESFGALKGTSPIAETRDFSVEKNQHDLIKQLETAALKGDRVNLHFVKRYMKFPWRGDTKYFVTRVETE
jgi:hypothetical protein